MAWVIGYSSYYCYACKREVVHALVLTKDSEGHEFVLRLCVHCNPERSP